MEKVTLGQRIRFLREERKLTQIQLAEAVEVTRSTLSLYEIGKRTPDLATLCRIARFFPVSLDYLLGLSDRRGETLNKDDLIALIGKKYADETTEETLDLLNTIEDARQVLADKEIAFAIRQTVEYKKKFSETKIKD